MFAIERLRKKQDIECRQPIDLRPRFMNVECVASESWMLLIY